MFTMCLFESTIHYEHIRYKHVYYVYYVYYMFLIKSTCVLLMIVFTFALLYSYSIVILY